MLHAAGFADQFAGDVGELLHEGLIFDALQRMMRQQEPYPMMVFNRYYDVVLQNKSSQKLMQLIFGEAAPSRLNLCEQLFDPAGMRPFIVDWERTARFMFARLHRELLHRPGDDQLQLLLSRLMAFDDVPQGWRETDFAFPSDPVLSVRFEKDEVQLAFFTTVTVFQAPQNAALEELHIESYFPIDDATEQLAFFWHKVRDVFIQERRSR